MQETAARATHNNVKIFFIEQGLKLVVFSRRGSKNNDIGRKSKIFGKESSSLAARQAVSVLQYGGRLRPFL